MRHRPLSRRLFGRRRVGQGRLQDRDLEPVPERRVRELERPGRRYLGERVLLERQVPLQLHWAAQLELRSSRESRRESVRGLWRRIDGRHHLPMVRIAVRNPSLSFSEVNYASFSLSAVVDRVVARRRGWGDQHKKIITFSRTINAYEIRLVRSAASSFSFSRSSSRLRRSTRSRCRVL